MDKKAVSNILEEIGTMLEIQGENPFKCRAYYNAARIIASLSQDIDELVREGSLQEIKGIGTTLSQKITELVTTGSMAYYNELKAKTPHELLDMLKIQGLGPKKIKAIYEKLHISTIGELEYSCHENRLIDLEGFGKKTQDKILQGIQYLKKNMELHLYSLAEESAVQIVDQLKAHKDILRISIAGSLRRKKEVIKDIDIVVSTENSPKIMEFFTTLPQVEHITGKGDTKSSVILKSGINSDLRTVSNIEFPYALHHLTGSKEHNTRMRSRAKGFDMKMNEYGLFKDESLISCENEEDIFHSLGLSYIPPELREDMGEIEAAESGGLPELLVPEDIKGIFHIHSTWSDGASAIEDLCIEAMVMGYSYIGISDHSKSAHYANGLSPERIEKQADEIDRLNKKYKDITIFKGIESDILPDGNLDYEDDILAMFDFVIGSIHTRFQMTEAEMTERIITAMKNPFMTMLGHPTGRLLLAREGYPVDLYKVIDAAREYNIIVELNANPYRLDLDWRYMKYAKRQSVLISINPDAHQSGGLKDTRYGIGIARKGWLSKEDVFNTLSKEVVADIFNKKSAKKKA